MPLRRRDRSSPDPRSLREKLSNLFSKAEDSRDVSPPPSFQPDRHNGQPRPQQYSGDSWLPLPGGGRPQYTSRAQSPSNYGVSGSHAGQLPFPLPSPFNAPRTTEWFDAPPNSTPPPMYRAHYLSPPEAINVRSRSASGERFPPQINFPAQIVNIEGMEYVVLPAARDDDAYDAGPTRIYTASPPMQRLDPQPQLIDYISDAATSDESFDQPTISRPPGYIVDEAEEEPGPSDQASTYRAFQDCLGISSDANTTSNTNLNRRYDYLPESMIPMWYNKDAPAVPQGARFLCGTCRHIDFLALFRQEETDVMPKPNDYALLGTLESLISRIECGFCRLVAKVIYADIGSTLPVNMDAAERVTKKTNKLAELMSEPYYLCPIRFKTTFREPILYILSGSDVADAVKQKSAMRPRGSMAIKPVHVSAPNLGRLLKTPTQIDFGWIRERIRLCDERDVGRLNYRHGVNVRAIDVHSLRLVDLEDNVRYVTLSYTWGPPGGKKQLILQRENEHFFRSGGLKSMWAEVPKTIRDSITLVREIGEEYLWIDALCIIQDDPEDRPTQIREMADIYGNSILTVCVCCGEDANYGLPGIEDGTRTTHQVAEIVGDIVIGNSVLGQRHADECKWDTRGWTLQEKVLSQRKLQIYDTCARWWCWHTISAEDENCRHTWWKPGTQYRWMYFFKDEHDLVVSKIDKNSNMDIYAFIVSDYTARDLTYQSDAENAVMGALHAIKNLFRGQFISGMPDTSLVAALLWVPIKSSKRRIDPKTGEALFPSWSWLGWQGHAAYPWLIERAIPMSEDGSPFMWRNLQDGAFVNLIKYDQWFTGNDYRRDLYSSRLRTDRWKLDDFDGWTWIDDVSPSHRWLHPVAEEGYRGDDLAMYDPCTQRLCLRTLAAYFELEDRLRARPERYDYLHEIHLARIVDSRGFYAGCIFTPDPGCLSTEEHHNLTGVKKFIVLSRASSTSDPRIGADLLHTTPTSELCSVYSLSHMAGALARSQSTSQDESTLEASVDPASHFDTRVYDTHTPWNLFNVMMIEERDGIAYRLAVGRIHVAAFMEAEPFSADVTLG